MLSAKLNQLLNGAIDQTIQQYAPIVHKAAQEVVFDMSRRGLFMSSAAEQSLAIVHIEAMQKAADKIWSEAKRVLQEVCVQPYAEFESDILALLKSKLLALHTVIKNSFQRNRNPHYTFQDQLPKFEFCLKQLESKINNEVAIFCIGLEAQKTEKEANRMSSHITYNLHGSNPRININSQDHSINIDNSKIVFDEIRKRIETEISDEGLKNELRVKVGAMEQNVGQKTFGQKYSDFITSAANHMTVFAPLLPALTQFLSASGI